MKRKNITLRKPFGKGRSFFGPGLIRTKRQRRVAAMVRKRRSAGLMSDAEYKRLKKASKWRSTKDRRGKMRDLMHELYGPSENPMAKKKRTRKRRQPAALAAYWAKRRGTKKKNSRRRRRTRNVRRIKLTTLKPRRRRRAVARRRPVRRRRVARANPRRHSRSKRNLRLRLTLNSSQKRTLARFLRSATGKRVRVQ